MGTQLIKSDIVPGEIIGCTRIANNSTSSGYGVETLPNLGMTPLVTSQGTEFSITFITPASGSVEIVFTCFLYTSSTTVAFALSSTASGTGFTELDETHTYDQGTYRMDETDSNVISVSWIVTGLGAGTERTYYIAAQEISGTNATISHGRFRSTGKHYPPVTIKAIALPNTVTTGE